MGGETTYEIRVFNQGSKAASKVQVMVALPPGLQLVSAAGDTKYTTQGGGVAFEPNRVSLNLSPDGGGVAGGQVIGKTDAIGGTEFFKTLEKLMPAERWETAEQSRQRAKARHEIREPAVVSSRCCCSVWR